MTHDLQVYLREIDPVTYCRLLAQAKAFAGVPESDDDEIALRDPNVDEHLRRLAAAWAVEELQHVHMLPPSGIVSGTAAFAAVSGVRLQQGLHL